MNPIFKKVLWSIVGVLVSVVMFCIAWFCVMLWDLGVFGNWGSESGYYGDFNIVKHVIDEMPSVQITNQWQHRDMSIESFGFTILVDHTNLVQVDFIENSTRMAETNRERIRAYVEEDIKKARTTGRTVLRPGPTTGRSPFR